MKFFLRGLAVYFITTSLLIGCAKAGIINLIDGQGRNNKGQMISMSQGSFVRLVNEVLGDHNKRLDNHVEQFDCICNCIKGIIDEQIKQKKSQEKSGQKELNTKLKQGLDISFEERKDQSSRKILKELKAYIDQKFDSLVKPIQQNPHIINQSELGLQSRQPYSSSEKQKSQNNSVRLLPIENACEASSYPCQDCNYYYSLYLDDINKLFKGFGEDKPDVDFHKSCVDALLYTFLKNTWPFNLYINYALGMGCNLSYDDIRNFDYEGFCFDYYCHGCYGNRTNSEYESFQTYLKHCAAMHKSIVDLTHKAQLNQFEDFYRRCNKDRSKRACNKCRAYYKKYFSQDYEKDGQRYRTYDYNDSRLKCFLQEGQLFHRPCVKVLVDEEIKEYEPYIRTYRRANNGASPAIHEISQAFNHDTAAVTNSFLKCKALQEYGWSPF